MRREDVRFAPVPPEAPQAPAGVRFATGFPTGDGRGFFALDLHGRWWVCWEGRGEPGAPLVTWERVRNP